MVDSGVGCDPVLRCDSGAGIQEPRPPPPNSSRPLRDRRPWDRRQGPGAGHPSPDDVGPGDSQLFPSREWKRPGLLQGLVARLLKGRRIQLSGTQTEVSSRDTVRRPSQVRGFRETLIPRGWCAPSLFRHVALAGVRPVAAGGGHPRDWPIAKRLPLNGNTRHCPNTARGNLAMLGCNVRSVGWFSRGGLAGGSRSAEARIPPSLMAALS